MGLTTLIHNNKTILTAIGAFGLLSASTTSVSEVARLNDWCHQSVIGMTSTSMSRPNLKKCQGLRDANKTIQQNPHLLKGVKEIAMTDDWLEHRTGKKFDYRRIINKNCTYLFARDVDPNDHITTYAPQHNDCTKVPSNWNWARRQARNNEDLLQFLGKAIKTFTNGDIPFGN